MSLADIILPDRYFYAYYNYKAYEVPLQEKANILLHWKSFGCEGSKQREKGN